MSAIGRVAFARRALDVELKRLGLDDFETCTDCLDGLAILLGNRITNDLEVGHGPALLVALADAEGMTLHPRAMLALRST